MKHCASPDIVNLLLKSGANPTSNITAHDSALTIAGKYSSPFLPQLIKYVSTSGSLNNVDSEGNYYTFFCSKRTMKILLMIIIFQF